MIKPSIFHHNLLGGDEIPAWGGATIISSSIELGWQGMQIEVGRGRGFHVEDYMVNGHYIAVNLSDVSLHQEYRDGLIWKSSAMPPLTFWINPEGSPFSFRHSNDMYCGLCLVDGKYLDAVMGHHYELRAGIGVVDEPLVHLVQAIIANIQDQRRYTYDFAKELLRTFVYALATRHGNPASALPAKGGIAPSQLKSLVSWLETRIGDPLTIDSMASQVGLSTAHFSREFKHATGQTPWGYFIYLRLERARQLLEDGESVTNVALQTGFSDQPHLSRLFKQRFGVNPSSIVGNRKN